MPWQRRSRREITESFPSEHPWLYEHREEPLLLIDGCLHSGNSAAPVLDGLKGVGFTDIRLEVASFSRKLNLHVACKPDIVLAKKPLGRCYPFSVDKMTEKTHAASVSQVAQDPKRREMAVYLRRNLDHYFGHAVYLESDNQTES